MGMDDFGTSSRFCILPKTAEGFSKKNLVRGTTRHIFSSCSYVRLFALPRRNATGNGISNEQSKMSEQQWSEICVTTSLYKKLYRAYVSTEDVQRISAARSVISLQSFLPPVSKKGFRQEGTFASLGF